MTGRRAAQLALLGVAAVAWMVAAALLWRTEVPDDLALPELDLRDYFSARELQEAADFERFLRIHLLLSQLVLLLTLAAWIWRGPRYTRESAAGPIGTGILLGMLGLGLVWLTQLPFAVAEIWWLRRHDLLLTGWGESLLTYYLALSGEFVGIAFVLLIVMGFARWLGERWWLAAAPVFVALAAFFAFVFPYLGDTERLDDPALRSEARAIAREQGLGDVRVDVEEVADETPAPNAYATGFGPAKRVVLWDTLLELPDEQVVSVIAHEFAHLSREHVLKSIGLYALLAFPGAYLVARLTRRRGGMGTPTAVPLSLFVVTVLGLLALVPSSAVSRRYEAEADWVALETTEDPDAARQLFERFTEITLSEPDPPDWFELISSHPSVEQRIAMVLAWREREGRGAETP
jgi:STE24 endopeptidase